MTNYRIDAKSYYQGIGEDLESSSALAFVGSVNVFQCKRAMKGLINRYSLSTKSILSLGSGQAFEEYWFSNSRCKLVLNDLDIPTGQITIENYLKSLPQVTSDEFVYCIDDADKVLREFPNNQFDALYVSSFHPDEIRREKIQDEFKNCRSEAQAQRYITWPADSLPYSNTLVAAIKKIKPGGLAIFQHYRGGVYVDTNPHYIQAIRQQFRDHGAELIETYSFRQSPPHMLAIAYIGSETEAQKYSREFLINREEISTFHGRYPSDKIKTDVVKTFDISKPDVSPEKAFLLNANDANQKSV